MQRFILSRIIVSILFITGNLSPLGAADSFLAAEKPNSRLLDSPVPFYHDHNLASLFPVGKHLGESAESGGPKRFTLEECVDLALQNNPDHNISRAVYRATTGDLFMAWGYFTPLLSAQYGLSQSNSSIPIMDRDGNITGRSGRIYREWLLDNLNLYVMAELDFDASQDVDALIDRYFRDLYGPAAGEVKTLYSLLEKRWDEAPGELGITGYNQLRKADA